MDGRTPGVLLPLGPADPRTLGGYTLEGRIGAGGQATVYLGRSAAGEPVAVKVFGAQWLADPEALAQVAAEIEALRRVPAFGTARLVAAHPEATPAFLVSEYVPGPTLEQQVLRSGPLTGAALDRFCLATLTALRSVHQAGLVHRDLKPGNVILGPDGPRIVDFGIVARHGDAEDPTDGVLGTREYLAPELLEGARVERSADLYAWAATVAYAATGRAPNSPDDGLDGVPDGLRAVLRRCLDPDPAVRPDAAQAMDLVLAAATPAEAGPQAAAVPPPLPVVPAAAPAVPPPADPAVPAWGTPPAAAAAAATPAYGSPPSVTPAYGVPSRPAPTPPKPPERLLPPWKPSPSSSVPVPVRARSSKVPGVLVGLVALGIFAAANSGNDGSADPGFSEPASPYVQFDQSGGSAAAQDPAAARAAVVYPDPEQEITRTDSRAAVRVAQAQVEPKLPWAISPSADGTTVAVPQGCGIRTWTVAPKPVAGQEVRAESLGGSGCVASVVGDGRYLVAFAHTGSFDTTLTLTDLGAGTRRTWTLRFPFDVDRMSSGAAGSRLLVAASGSAWQLVALDEGAVVGAPLTAAQSSRYEAWVADGALDRMAMRTAAGTMIWSLARGEAEVANLPTDLWAPAEAALSPDGRTLAVLRPDGQQVALWDVATQTVTHTVRSDGAVRALAFSADSRQLAAAGPQGVRVWEAETGTPVGPRFTYPAADVKVGATVHQLTFSQDGSRLFLATGSGAVLAWDVREPGTGPSATA